jgi:hypothetical protein
VIEIENEAGFEISRKDNKRLLMICYSSQEFL